MMKSSIVLIALAVSLPGQWLRVTTADRRDYSVQVHAGDTARTIAGRAMGLRLSLPGKAPLHPVLLLARDPRSSFVWWQVYWTTPDFDDQALQQYVRTLRIVSSRHSIASFSIRSRTLELCGSRRRARSLGAAERDVLAVIERRVAATMDFPPVVCDMSAGIDLPTLLGSDFIQSREGHGEPPDWGFRLAGVDATQKGWLVHVLNGSGDERTLDCDSELSCAARVEMPLSVAAGVGPRFSIGAAVRLDVPLLTGATPLQAIGRVLDVRGTTAAGTSARIAYASVYDPGTKAFWYNVDEQASDSRVAMESPFAGLTFVAGDSRLVGFATYERFLVRSPSRLHFESLKQADDWVFENEIPAAVRRAESQTIYGTAPQEIDLASALGPEATKSRCPYCPYKFAIVDGSYSAGLWHLEISDGAGRRYQLTLDGRFAVVSTAP